MSMAIFNSYVTKLPEGIIYRSLDIQLYLRKYLFHKKLDTTSNIEI